MPLTDRDMLRRLVASRDWHAGNYDVLGDRIDALEAERLASHGAIERLTADIARLQQREIARFCKGKPGSRGTP